jgi:prepilin-type N-terminal cleavage/methylation domain-containing protein
MRRGFTLRQAQGFTLIEAIIVIAMMVIIAVMAAPFLSDVLVRRDAELFAAEASDALREAQSSAMSGRNNARWGVHFEETKFVLFDGGAYNSADPDNIVHALSGQVAITAVTLSPGGACTIATGSGNCDVHFANRRGTPTETGSIVFTGADGTARTVTLNGQGMIDVN